MQRWKDQYRTEGFIVGLLVGAATAALASLLLAPKSGKDLRKAFHYYTISSESLRFTLCPWSKYNLAKYFYKDGNLEIDVKQDINKAIELLEDIADELIEASKELLFIYYDLYIKSGKEDKNYLEKVYLYKEKCEKNINYNDKIKQDIENKLKQINIITSPIDIL